mgnify:CR=1 FL=1
MPGPKPKIQTNSMGGVGALSLKYQKASPKESTEQKRAEYKAKGNTEEFEIKKEQEIPTRLSQRDKYNKKLKTLKYKRSNSALPPGKSILMKADGGRINYKHGGAALRGISPILKK